ncbi:MAG: hypothetical protein WHT07_08820 [Desulfobaccales bacterium]
MNGGNCMNCQNSPWVLRANNYIQNATTPNEHRITVQFLLNEGYCGASNRVKIDDILQHLYQNNIYMSREEFQNNILTELKRQGIVATFVYPGRQGGVFIPCSESDIREVCLQVISRVCSELLNLEGLTVHTRFYNIIHTLRINSDSAKNSI